MLSQLNEAVINIEVSALGKSEEFSLTEGQLEESRRVLAEFIARLQKELEQNTSTADLQSLVFRMRTGMKALEDWQEDLASLAKQLANAQPMKFEDLPILEDILSLLDIEFADDLRRLYSH